MFINGSFTVILSVKINDLQLSESSILLAEHTDQSVLKLSIIGSFQNKHNSYKRFSHGVTSAKFTDLNFHYVMFKILLSNCLIGNYSK